MNNNRFLSAILLISAVVLVAYSGTRRQGPPTTQSVLVTNATTQAVPVKNGSTPLNVTVGNTIGQPLPVKQNGNWYVGLLGYPKVQVVNAATTPAFTQDASTVGAHQYNAGLQIYTVATSLFTTATFSVNTGTFVVRNVTAYSDCGTGGEYTTRCIIYAGTEASNYTGGLFFPLQQDPLNATFAECNVPCYWSVPAGTQINVEVDRQNATEGVTTWVTLSGYIVPN